MLKTIAIDDEPQFLNLLPQIINWETYGFTLTETFTDANEAIKYIENNHVDIVFSDIKMPNMDGFEFAKLMKKKHPNIAVVILTAHKEFEYAQKLIQFGIFDYLTKPLNYNNLINLLSRLKKHFIPNKSSSYDDAMTIWALQEAILNFSSNKIDIDELENIFNNYDVTIDFSSSNSVISYIEIHDLLNFINTSWIYGLDRLYIRIIQSMQNKDFYTILLNTSFNRMCVLIISKHKLNNDSFKEMLKDFTKNTQDFFKTYIQLNTDIAFAHITDDIENIKKHIKVFSANAVKLTDDELILKVLDYIEENFSKNPSLTELSNMMFVSPYHLSRLFKKHTGINISEYILNKKLEYAKHLLMMRKYTTSEIAVLSGFGDKTYFHHTFKKNVGLTPNEYAKMHGVTL